MPQIKLRFWDGEREYEGEVCQLSREYVLARIKIFKGNEDTILPRHSILEAMRAHLLNRVLPLEIGKGEAKADLLAKVTSVVADASHPRRAILRAAFTNPRDVDTSKLARLMDETKVID